jgi:S-DNA-T family DNA segregation ATPase FtsK/SpoIIIE
MAKQNIKARNKYKESQKKSVRKKISFSLPKNKAERIKRIIGLFLIIASVFMLVAFTSFLFSWKADQNLVYNSDSFVQASEYINLKQTSNWAGLLGAYISYVFMAKWFGLSSYLFIFLFFTFGVWLLFDTKLFSLKKTVPSTLFAIFWFSTTFGLFFSKTAGLVAGSFGIYSYLWLRGLLGVFGTVFILFFLLIAYLILVFNYKIEIPAIFKKANKQEEDIPETDNEDPEIESNTVEDLTEEPNLKITVEKDNIIETKVEDEKELTKKPEESEIDFVIEKVEEEEESETETRKVNIEELDEYDPKKELSNYKYPTVDLLLDYEDSDSQVTEKELSDRKNLIVQTLKNYGIEIDKIKASVGSTVTLYEIVPVAGVRISKIKNLEDDIALSLAALGIRIIAPIPGKGTIGIEVPNSRPEIVSIKSVLGSSKFQNFDKELPFVIGKTISNEVFVADLAKMPHLLIAGATGQGKSVGLNVIIASLLYKKHPAELKFILVDPKKVELSLFQKIENHFLAKLPDSESSVITDVTEVVNTLGSLTAEMDQRYLLLKDAHCRNIVEYNKKFVKRRLNPENGHRYLPYIVLVIDELADLMMTAGKEVELPIARLAQLARAIGIHLIIATQRPSVNIITGTIKANFPARIAFKVSAAVDSRTILDSKGAEQLIGRGDLLFSTGNDLIRIQCALIETEEVEKVVDFISEQDVYPSVHLLPEVKSEGEKAEAEALDDLDSMFEDAARIVVQHQQGSTSLLQRRLKLGYNRAGRIIDQLESAGVVGPFEGSKARNVLIPDEYALEQFLKDFMDNK